MPHWNKESTQVVMNIWFFPSVTKNLSRKKGVMYDTVNIQKNWCHTSFAIEIATFQTSKISRSSAILSKNLEGFKGYLTRIDAILEDLQ